MTRRPHAGQAGFSLIELMVVISVIAIILSVAVPNFGNAVRSSRERYVVQRLAQDFSWARGAAGAADASLLNASLSGMPAVTMTLNADCSWSLAVNGTALADHSMSPSALASTAPSMTCSSTASLPATFTFTAAGLVDTTGTVTFVGAGTQAYPMQIFSSGSMLRLSPVQGAQS